MKDPRSSLSINDAVAEFQMIFRDELGNDVLRAEATPLTPAEREDSLFRLAEHLLSLACPDPRACADRRCQRNSVCRHTAVVKAKHASGTSSHPRRTAGAEAVRYAMWAYMSSRR
jgi:hypothetical protein